MAETLSSERRNVKMKQLKIKKERSACLTFLEYLLKPMV